MGSTTAGLCRLCVSAAHTKEFKYINGRSISLWPHGILFRDSEAEMRSKMIKEDLVECVIGLGPNLFYNSPMEACLLITKTNKSDNKKGKVLFINAVKEVKQDKNIAFLEQQHIDKIYTIYKNFSEESEIAKIVSNEKLLENKGSLNIAQFLSNVDKSATELSVSDALDAWNEQSSSLKGSMNKLFQILN